MCDVPTFICIVLCTYYSAHAEMEWHVLPFTESEPCPGRGRECLPFGLDFSFAGRGRPWALCLPHRPTDATIVSSSKQFRTLRATEAGRWRFRGARGFALRSRGPAPPRPSLPHAFRSRVSVRPDASQGDAYKVKWEKLLFCVPSRGLPVTHSTKSFPRLTNN